MQTFIRLLAIIVIVNGFFVIDARIRVHINIQPLNDILNFSLRSLIEVIISFQLVLALSVREWECERIVKLGGCVHVWLMQKAKHIVAIDNLQCFKC